MVLPEISLLITLTPPWYFRQLEAPPPRATENLQPSALLVSGPMYILSSSTRPAHQASIRNERAPRLHPHLRPYSCTFVAVRGRLVPPHYLRGGRRVHSPTASIPNRWTPERTTAWRPERTEQSHGGSIRRKRAPETGRPGGRPPGAPSRMVLPTTSLLITLAPPWYSQQLEAPPPRATENLQPSALLACGPIILQHTPRSSSAHTERAGAKAASTPESLFVHVCDC